MSDIAHSTITGSLDTAAKFFRTILKAGVSLEQLMLPVDNRTARANFVAFMKAGCPKLSSIEIASSEAASKPSILDFVTEVEVEGCERFSSGEKFREGETIDGVKISWLGNNFKGNLFGKTDKDIAPATLRIHKLKENSVDAPILGELRRDTPDAAETTLFHLWELLKKQGQGQEGVLLVNGWANIFYIRQGNTLWAVLAFWNSGRGWYVGAVSVTLPVEWFVGASSVTNPGRWLAGAQVVSR